MEMTVDPFNRGKHHAAVVVGSLALAALLWAAGYGFSRIIAAVPWFLLSPVRNLVPGHVLLVFQFFGWDVVGFVVGMSAWAFAALDSHHRRTARRGIPQDRCPLPEAREVSEWNLMT